MSILATERLTKILQGIYLKKKRHFVEAMKSRFDPSSAN
jgi:hypothetical protein